MAPKNLLKLLQWAAKHRPSHKITTYQPNEKFQGVLDYGALLWEAETRAHRLRNRERLRTSTVVLLHFGDQIEAGLIWFWTVIATGAIPCICTPFPIDPEQRKKRIRELQVLLSDPLIITADDLVADFCGLEGIRLTAASDIESTPDTPGPIYGWSKEENNVAVLMLTSGSTGIPKAVCLQHGQIMASVRGKSELHQTTKDDVFLNFTGLDHVASLVEVHLQAMSLGANQIHLPYTAFFAEPMDFLAKIDKHKVTYTFATNTFLVGLIRTMESANQGSATKTPTFDISSLRVLISGGEANVVETCVKLTDLLRRLGAPTSFIRPGFGMTETCAGAIYNAKDCPTYDIVGNAEFACLGDCIPGIQMRIVRSDHKKANANEIGMLELAGPVIFNKYYANEGATAASFTDDGWFKTGDRGFLDSNGRLYHAGRDKDLVVINGVNHSPQAIEAALEDAQILGMGPSFAVVFPHRPKNSATEVLCIVYSPTYEQEDAAARVDTAVAISKTVLTYCGNRPYKIIPLEASILQKSSLGKLPRSKIRQAFENGDYQRYQKIDEHITRSFVDVLQQPAFTETQQMIIDVYQDLFPNEISEVGINSDLFKIGFSSLDLLQLRNALQKRVNLDIPLTTIFGNPLVSDLASAIDALHEKREYDPVNTLRSAGTKTSLWLIHPGVGEILIFMDLAHHIIDRPVYALRARGFDGEAYFNSLEEMIKVYHDAIKRVQPTGPYALTGYSYGSILVFELTKLMTSQGDEVKFLATIDQPPLFKKRAASYDYNECVLTIAFFLGFIKEDYAYKTLKEDVRPNNWTHADVLKHIFTLAPASRVEELGHGPAKLDNWAKLALQLKKNVSTYDPTGKVPHMDVFYTSPLVGLVAANSLQEWYDGFISKWSEFVEEPRYHVVEGTHRTLISQPHILGFQRVFKKAMIDRGL